MNISFFYMKKSKTLKKFLKKFSKNTVAQKILIWVVLFFLVFVLSLFVFRSQIQTLMSFPAAVYNVQNFVWYIEADIDFEKITFTNSRGNVIDGLVIDNKAEKTIYYFHWNWWPLSFFYSEIQYMSELWYNVIAYDYPGYGESEWFPDDAEVFATSYEFLQEAQKIMPIESENLIVWGYSIGTTVATDFAYKNDFDKLILIAPVYSRYEMSRFYFGFVLQKYLGLPDSLQNYKKIQTIKNPTLIIHGNADKIVPFSGWKKVYENSIADIKNFVEIDDFGHNYIIDYKGEYLRPYIIDFLQPEEVIQIDSEISTPEAIEKNIAKEDFSTNEENIAIPSQTGVTVEKFSANIWTEKDGAITQYVWPTVSFNDLTYIPSDLWAIESEYVIDSKGNGSLRYEANTALNKMATDFYKEFEEKIVVVSSYRSYAYQKWIKDRGCPDNLCSKAGFSEHQSWLAIDLWEASNYNQFMSQEKLKNYYEWLKKNSHLYGFHNSYQKWIDIDGYDREPWHWRYLWVPLSSQLQKSGQTFAEYYFSDNK